MNEIRMKKYSKWLVFCFCIQLFTVPLFAKKVVLKNGTPIQLRVLQTIDSGSATIGQVYSLATTHVVKVEEQTVIEAGAIATGLIVDVEEAKVLGQGGSLTVEINTIKAIDGSNIPVSASRIVKGKDKTSTSIIVGILCLLGFLIEGEDATLQHGTTIQAYTVSDAEIGI